MKGKLFIIESGTDGSGKATQAKKLFDRLKEEGYLVRKVEYPNYQSDSSALIKMYLNGEFGNNPEDVNAYAASMFYAVDRFASYQKAWKAFYEAGGIVVADRYTTSNMVHQASKLQSIEEKNAYLDWLWDVEFIKCGLPVPDEVIFLDVDPAVSMALMQNRSNKYTGEDKKDIHEKNRGYLQKSYENARWIAEKYGWTPIQCVGKGALKSIEEIHEEIYRVIKQRV